MVGFMLKTKKLHLIAVLFGFTSSLLNGITRATFNIKKVIVIIV